MLFVFPIYFAYFTGSREMLKLYENIKCIAVTLENPFFRKGFYS